MAKLQLIFGLLVIVFAMVGAMPSRGSMKKRDVAPVYVDSNGDQIRNRDVLLLMKAYGNVVEAAKALDQLVNHYGPEKRDDPADKRAGEKWEYMHFG